MEFSQEMLDIVDNVEKQHRNALGNNSTNSSTTNTNNSSTDNNKKNIISTSNNNNNNNSSLPVPQTLKKYQRFLVLEVYRAAKFKRDKVGIKDWGDGHPYVHKRTHVYACTLLAQLFRIPSVFSLSLSLFFGYCTDVKTV